MKISGLQVNLAAALLFLSGPSALLGAGSGSTYITVEKAQKFDQTAATGAVADPATPFVFQVQSPVAMSFTPPGGLSTVLTMPSGSSKYQFEQSYGTQAAMDAAYPDGSYTFGVTGSAGFALSLSGDLYPNPPELTSGSWNSSGQLVLDPTQANVLNLNTFTSYGTAGALSHMQVQIQSPDGNTVSLSQTYVTPTNPAAFTSYTIPAGTLAPGSFYYGDIEFDTAAADNATAVPGYTAATVYTASTLFTIVTSGTATNAPTITLQPQSQTAPLGSTVTFNVQFTGGDSNNQVQWFKNGIAILQNGSTGAGLTLSNLQNSDAGNYYAIVSSGAGAYAQTVTATLTIGATTSSPPAFTTQPNSVTIADNTTVVFHAAASGSPTLTYQWYLNGSPLVTGPGIDNATGASLVIRGATFANAGTYYSVATNASGTAQSQSAVLTVENTTDIGRLINISCRAQVGTGGDILIAGFVVGGAGTSGSQKLLIRGTGPALSGFGVTGVLPDPELQVYNGANPPQLLATNEAWAGGADGGASVTAADTATGAFALTSTTSHDTALVETLPSGGYTAQISGESGDTGDALAEVYDATPAGTYTPATPRLINLAARVQVGTGGNILIAGFVIGGSTAKTVLIRASGPALAPFGVSGTLPDPLLKLYAGNTLLGSNQGWGGKSDIANAAAQVGAFAWSDPSSNDSAILATLPPGAYSAEILGASGDTGVALVEVYEDP
jgi:hypothetical protein